MILARSSSARTYASHPIRRDAHCAAGCRHSHGKHAGADAQNHFAPRPSALSCDDTAAVRGGSAHHPGVVGHSQVSTTHRYAAADVEMMRRGLDKAGVSASCQCDINPRTQCCCFWKAFKYYGGGRSPIAAELPDCGRAATYLRPTHKCGYVARHIAARGRSLRVRGKRGDLIKIIWHDGQGACYLRKDWSAQVHLAIDGRWRRDHQRRSNVLSALRH